MTPNIKVIAQGAVVATGSLAVVGFTGLAALCVAVAVPEAIETIKVPEISDKVNYFASHMHEQGLLAKG